MEGRGKEGREGGEGKGEEGEGRGLGDVHPTFLDLATPLYTALHAFQRNKIVNR